MTDSLPIGLEMSISRTPLAPPDQASPAHSPKKRSRYLAKWKDIVLDSSTVREPQRFEYEFAETGGKLAIEGAGLERLYVIFGASGMGKSYLLRKLLVRLAEQGGEHCWGGLLLDPKRSLLEEIQKFVPASRLAVVGSSSGQRLNLLKSHLEPRDLGVAVALAAQAAGIAGGDPYWLNEMKRLFSAGLTLLKLMGWPVTLAGLAELLVKHELARGCAGGQADPARNSGSEDSNDTARRQTKPPVRSILDERILNANDRRGELSGDDQRRLDNALSELLQFSVSKGENVDTVRSFLHQALSSFLEPELDCVSDDTRLDGKRLDGIADMVFRHGKLVLLDIGRGSLASGRMVATLAKVLFQRAALERDREGVYPEYRDRRVFLAADEYAEVASDLPGEGFGDSIFFSQMRSARVLGLIATQGAPMLDNSGVRDTWKTVLTNAGGKLFFRVDDHDTASLAASLAGEGDVVVADHNVGQAHGAANVQLGRKLERRSLLATDLFLMGLARGQLVFIGCADGESRSSIRYARVEQ